MSAHTPGPWTWEGDHTHRVFEVRQLAHLIDASAFAKHICTINNLPPAHRQNRDPVQAEANARLIAAAPEMYELLVSLLGDDSTANSGQWAVLLAKIEGKK
mgnify:CR=1 FL=1